MRSWSGEPITSSVGDGHETCQTCVFCAGSTPLACPQQAPYTVVLANTEASTSMTAPRQNGLAWCSLSIMPSKFISSWYAVLLRMFFRVVVIGAFCELHEMHSLSSLCKSNRNIRDSGKRQEEATAPSPLERVRQKGTHPAAATDSQHAATLSHACPQLSASIPG